MSTFKQLVFCFAQFVYCSSRALCVNCWCQQLEHEINLLYISRICLRRSHHGASDLLILLTKSKVKLNFVSLFFIFPPASPDPPVRTVNHRSFPEIEGVELCDVLIISPLNCWFISLISSGWPACWSSKELAFPLESAFGFRFLTTTNKLWFIVNSTTKRVLEL